MGSANVDVDQGEGDCLVGNKIEDDNHVEDEDAAPDHRRRDGRMLSANTYDRGCALPLAVAVVVAVVAMTTVDLIAMNVLAVGPWPRL